MNKKFFRICIILVSVAMGACATSSHRIPANDSDIGNGRFGNAQKAAIERHRDLKWVVSTHMSVTMQEEASVPFLERSKDGEYTQLKRTAHDCKVNDAVGANWISACKDTFTAGPKAGKAEIITWISDDTSVAYKYRFYPALGVAGAFVDGDISSLRVSNGYIQGPSTIEVSYGPASGFQVLKIDIFDPGN